MKIYGIDVNCLTRENYTGTERYVFSLMKEMMTQPLQKDERVVLYTSAKVEELGDLPDGWSWSVLNWPLAKGWTHGRLSWELLRRTPNVFFSPAHEIPRFYGRTKIVNTVHDVAFVYFPKAYTWLHRRRHAWSVKRSVRNSNAIITVSGATKKDLVYHYKAKSEIIIPIPLAIDHKQFSPDTQDVDRVLQKYRLFEKKYFFFVGRLEEKKNIVTLVRAFEEYKKHRGHGDPLQLVLAGTYGYGKQRIENTIKTSPIRDDIRVLGFVPDKDLAGLFSGCLAFTFPSLYEGFGMPVLEAMASGVPVLASDIPALREVCGQAALFCEAQSVAQWSQALDRLAHDRSLRDDLLARGAGQVKAFTWKKTAEKTWQVLRSV